MHKKTSNDVQNVEVIIVKYTSSVQEDPKKEKKRILPDFFFHQPL